MPTQLSLNSRSQGTSRLEAKAEADSTAPSTPEDALQPIGSPSILGGDSPRFAPFEHAFPANWKPKSIMDPIEPERSSSKGTNEHTSADEHKFTNGHKATDEHKSTSEEYQELFKQLPQPSALGIERGELFARVNADSEHLQHQDTVRFHSNDDIPLLASFRSGYGADFKLKIHPGSGQQTLTMFQYALTFHLLLVNTEKPGKSIKLSRIQKKSLFLELIRSEETLSSKQTFIATDYDHTILSLSPLRDHGGNGLKKPLNSRSNCTGLESSRLNCARNAKSHYSTAIY
jgi:hypothetical protein